MLDFEDVQDCYFTAKDVVEGFINDQLYTYSRTPIEFLTHFNYENFCEEKLDFDFAPYKFKKLSKQVGGSLYIDNNDVVISYDINNSKSRQAFTKLHEIYHYFGHYKMGIKGNYFGQSINNNTLSYEDLILEQEANFGASFMQISDKGLAKCLIDKLSFSQICNSYNMSYSALYNRFLSFLVFEKDINESVARNTINKYRYSYNNTELKQLFFRQ